MKNRVKKLIMPTRISISVLGPSGVVEEGVEVRDWGWDGSWVGLFGWFVEYLFISYFD